MPREQEQASPQAQRIHIELLGAPRVSRGDVPLRLPVKKSLALLAFLAVEGRATRAKLASLFWGEVDGDAARRNLRRELHRLREAGLGDALRTDDDLLSIADEVTSDAIGFTRALDSVDALPDWRGVLMDGFDLGESDGFDAWLAGKREDLLRRWVRAAAEHAQRREAAGDAAGAAQLHARLTEADPLQESHYANAMRLNYLRGERALALEYFERCCRMLKEQLGLQPLPATVALAEQIRATDRLAPLFARSGSRGPARFDAPLVGRTAEVQVLQRCGLPILLIEGEAGVGKSRLAQEVALDRRPYLHMQGAEAARNAALHPVSEVIRRSTADPTLKPRLQALAVDDRVELARLLPDVAGVAAPATSASPAGRQRFLNALGATLALLVQGGVLVVDDLHWLDDSSLDVLENLARHATKSGTLLRIIATARPVELADAPLARDLVRKLERAGLLQRLPLAPLTPQATLQLVRELSGSSGGELFARRLQQVTQGNAFFLLETLRYLFDIGELTLNDQGLWATPHDDATAAYAELPVPPTVQQALVERVERLGPAARRVLETAALAGDPFTLEDVQPATALGEFETLDGLERALQAQLLLHHTGAYRYVHDLARAALDASLLPDRRRLIHARLATTVQSRGGRADRVAWHLEEAGRRVEAIGWRVKAGEEALQLFARHEALAHYAQALNDGAAGLQALEIRLARIKVRRTLGLEEETQADFDAIDRLLLDAELASARPDLSYQTEQLRVMFHLDCGRTSEALQAAQRALLSPAPSADAEARLLSIASFAAAFLGEAALGVDYGERARALAQAADSRDLTAIETQLSYSYVNCGRAADAVVLTEQALRRPARSADPLVRAHLLAAAGNAHLVLGQDVQALALLDEALAVGRQTNAVGMVETFEANAALLHAKFGRHEAARRHAEAMTAAVGTSDNPRSLYMVATVQAEVAIAAGDEQAALDALARAVDVADQVGDPEYRRNARLLRAELLADAGQLDRALADAEAAQALTEHLGNRFILRCEIVRALVELARARPIEACARLRQALAAPRFGDERWQASTDLAHCVLGEALLGAGKPSEAAATVRGVNNSPRLRARALLVRMAADPADLDARHDAMRLLDGGTLPPKTARSLERLLTAAA